MTMPGPVRLTEADAWRRPGARKRLGRAIGLPTGRQSSRARTCCAAAPWPFLRGTAVRTMAGRCGVSGPRPGFDGLNGDGNLSIDGKVASGAFGLELAGENWLTGLALFHGLGEGGYEDRALGGTVYDEVGAWLTSGHPYLRWNPDEATTLWGTLGLGWGKMTVSDPTGDNEADIAMAMGAFGGNRQLLVQGRARPGGQVRCVLEPYHLRRDGGPGCGGWRRLSHPRRP